MILKYSNGWGHLIMSIVLLVVGLTLILAPGVDSGGKVIGLGLITTVSGYWMVTSTANSVVHQQAQSQQSQDSQDVTPVIPTREPKPLIIGNPGFPAPGTQDTQRLPKI